MEEAQDPGKCRLGNLCELLDLLQHGDPSTAGYCFVILDCAQLAVELGYFDQAHLINDFKSILGYTPTEFQKMR